MTESRKLYARDCRFDAVQAALCLLHGDGDFISAIRALCSLRSEIAAGPLEDDFLLFEVIASETHHLPTGDRLLRCSPDLRAEIDEQVQQCRAFYREALQESCVKIITRFRC